MRRVHENTVSCDVGCLEGFDAKLFAGYIACMMQEGEEDAPVVTAMAVLHVVAGLQLVHERTVTSDGRVRQRIRRRAARGLHFVHGGRSEKSRGAFIVIIELGGASERAVRGMYGIAAVCRRWRGMPEQSPSSRCSSVPVS